MDSKGLLVSYAGYPYSPTSFMPDNGLAGLAGALLEAGHKVKILDYNTPSLVGRLYPEPLSRRVMPVAEKILSGKKPGAGDIALLWSAQKILSGCQQRRASSIGAEISDIVRNEGISFVGLKLWNGDGFTGSLRIARELRKRCPGLLIFAGGPHVDIFRENIFAMTGDFDALVYGEGEQTIVMLAEYAASGGDLKNIPNLIFKKNKKIHTTRIKRIENLNLLPLPVYDEKIYPAMEGDEKIKMIVLDESRGCSNSCNFCIHPVKSGPIREKTASRVVDEMSLMQDKHGFSVFRYAGSSTPIELHKNIAREIIKRKLKVRYTAFGHVRKADGEVFRLMKESGCFGVFFGIESGSQRILNSAMNKGLPPGQSEKAVKLAREAGLFTAGSIIFPAPGENEKTEAETLELLSRCLPDAAPVQFPILVPGTKWFTDPERFGFSIDKKSFTQKAMNYKIKLIFPPRFWKPFPYKINGEPYKISCEKLDKFIKKVEALGITTTISDEIALLAFYAGMSPEKFRDSCRAALLSGNQPGISAIVRKINKTMASPQA